MKTVIVLLLLALMLCTSVLPAQETSEVVENKKDSSHINWWKLGPVIGASGGVFVYSQIKQTSNYWGDRAPFHFNFHDDWQYAHGGDKFGHAYFSYLLATTFRESFVFSGMDTTSAVWWAWGVALLHQSTIEVQDGFSSGTGGTALPYLGFSWGDFTANIVGASLPLAQHYYPFARNFRYKFSFKASEKIRQGGYYNSIADDYESKYHWLSINVYNLLPQAAQAYWTPFLNVAVGHSVKDIVDAPNHFTYQGYHELWLSVDYNFEALPGDAAWWKSVKKILNLYKLPAPCVRILPTVVWYGLRL